MRSLRGTSIALLLLCNTPSITMAEDEVTTSQFNACMEKADGVTPGMIDCMEAETKRQDAKLNQSYQKLSASVAPARKKQLLDAQRAWLTFRELNCAFYDDADGGQAARVSAKDCFITMTAKRATELSNLMTNE